MAKKELIDLSEEDKLSTLYHLQTTLSAIDEKRALRGELPLEVQDLEDEIEGLKIRIEKIQTEIDEFQKAVSDRKADILDAQASVARYKMQLDDVKNNREYDTLTKEIEFQSLEIELCKKKIKDKTLEKEQSERNLEDHENELEVKRSELDDIIEETRAEEDRLKVKVKEMEVKIDQRLLASFKRIRKNARNGLGIVYVQRDACGGCFNKIPPQRQLDIKMHKKVIVCEYCGRILIDPELAGVKTDKPVEDKKKTRKRSIRRKKEEE